MFAGYAEAAAKTDPVARMTGIITEMVAASGALVKKGDVSFLY